MSAQESPTFRRRYLGRLLRGLRDEARMSTDEVCRRLEFSPARLSRIENGRTATDVLVVKAMLDLYGLPVNDWAPYEQLAREAKKKGWWQEFGVEARGYVSLEAAASTLCHYELGDIPGLLQTEAHARTLFEKLSKRRGKHWIDDQIAVRLIRQQRLRSDIDPLEFAAIMDETVLWRPVGGPEVQREQMRHLLELAELPTVTLQVLPLSASPHVGLDGSFHVLGFAEKDEPDLAYVEHVFGSLQIEKEAEVRACKLAFERLRTEALTPDGSAELVRDVLARL
ncbi:helix-turn-helix domain-containing protein [Amycolatopsis palatopharyngis]|uniref:helix-turn-helix domain-containing protein n=1 Tax=Amycolatopsis palatopharyngis TaxID=187982 RepID=UPI000E286D2C|nr:helix-turn-helix transcriptional regulator [Amycolatopsis palatopharyngis]